MDLFDKPIYLYGKIIKKKLVTPYKSYQIDLPSHLKADYLPVKLLKDKLEVFYLSKIFNSYVLSVEENVKTLFSCDGKLTVTSEEVDEGRIYTFITINEDDNVRRVGLFKFDTLYPGRRTTGRVVTKRNKYFVSTEYGEGELVLQNNTFKKKIEVLLYRKDDTLHFVQIDNPIQTKVRVRIDSYTDGYYSVSDRNIKGILFTGNKLKIGSSLDCVPKDNNLGFYIFEEYKILSVGQEIEAEVVSRNGDVTNLKYGGHKGFIKGCSKGGRKIKGRIINIENEVFELSIRDIKMDLNKGLKTCENKEVKTCEDDQNKDVKTCVKDQNKEVKTFENKEVKACKDDQNKGLDTIKYDQNKVSKTCEDSQKISKNNPTKKSSINSVSIPFDIPSDDDKKEDSSQEISVDTQTVDLNLERKRSKFTNEDDCLMEIKAHPGKSLPILKYFKYLIEQNKQQEARKVFSDYSSSLVGKEKDDLSIAFVNYLIYTGDPDLYKNVKKLSQTCSARFLEVVTSNTDNLQISRLYYTMFPNKNSFKRYLEVLFSSDLKEAYKLMEECPKYLSISIPLLYTFGDDQRNRIERLITKNKDAWIEYLNHETGEYKRHLFRRVIEYDWNVKDMKTFFKMWLEFETKASGNVDEVRSRAKEFVEKIKTKEEEEKSQ